MARADRGATWAAPVGGIRRARALSAALPPLAGFGLPFLGVLVALLRFDPYYGLMDDATLLGFVGDVGRDGFAGVYADRVWSDIWSWGMVRPFYWALAYVHYRAGAESVTALYLLNWAVTGACLLAAGVGLGRAFCVPAARRPLFLGVYGAAVLAFPWTLDLFAFPSLQEKWVILAGGLGLVWFAEPRARLSPRAWYAVSAAVVVLG